MGKIRKTLVNYLGAGAIALGSIFGGYNQSNVKASELQIGFNTFDINNSVLKIKHIVTGTEGVGVGDSPYNPPFAPAIDLYSVVSSTDLSTDARPYNSFTTVNSEIAGRDDGNNNFPRSNALTFFINNGDGAFNGVNILGDLYGPTHSLITANYDLKNLALTSGTIPLPNINEGISYYLDVSFQAQQETSLVPESSSLELGLLGAAGLTAAGYAAARRKRRNEDERRSGYDLAA